MVDGSQARGLVVAAPASGSGKTLVATGLAAAFRARGAAVAGAKVGPDYIDPRFLEAATGAPVVNLDLWAMGESACRALAADAARGADLLIVEGVMGLFDGAAGGGGSTADLARALGLPVVLVVAPGSQAQSVAALVHGFSTFDPGLRVAGTILTGVRSERHASMLTAALAAAGLPCFGVLPHDPALALPSRHLGLVQASEIADLEDRIGRLTGAVSEGVDLDGIADAAVPAMPPDGLRPPALPPLGQRMAVARDDAFRFAYPHLLAGWRGAGAELAFFSPLADEAPDPAADAVFLPGGYPELHAGALAVAERFRAGMADAVGRGARVYGECGGYMVLGEGLVAADGTRHTMLGLLAHATRIDAPVRTLGYRRLALADPGGQVVLPFPPALAGHEFHYARLETNRESPLFRARCSEGRDLGAIGGARGRVAGSFAHVIAPALDEVAPQRP